LDLLEQQQVSMPETLDNKVVPPDGPWRRPLEPRRRNSVHSQAPANITGTNSTLNFFALPEDDHSSGADRSVGAPASGNRFDSTRDLIQKPKGAKTAVNPSSGGSLFCCCAAEKVEREPAAIQMTERRREGSRRAPPPLSATVSAAPNAATLVTLPDETQPELVDLFGEQLPLHRVAVFYLSEQQQVVDAEVDALLAERLDALRIFTQHIHKTAEAAALAAGIPLDFSTERDVCLALNQLRRNAQKGIRELLNALHEARQTRSKNDAVIEEARIKALSTSPIAFSPVANSFVATSDKTATMDKSRPPATVMGVRMYPLFVPDKEREIGVEKLLTEKELLASAKRGSSGGGE